MYSAHTHNFLTTIQTLTHQQKLILNFETLILQRYTEA